MFSEKPGVATDRAVWIRLLRQIATLSGRPQDANDYLNDAYVRMSEHEGSGIRNFEAFVVRIAVNLARDDQRRQRRRNVSSDEDLNAIADASPTPEEMLDVRQRLSAVQATLARLHPRTLPVTRRRLLIGGGAALTAAAGGFVALSAGAEVYRTDIGERRSLVLADRSKVLLDADSELRVRNLDTGCEATLERGCAHFDLQSRTTGSLVVRAGGCNLRIDRGTFEIETGEGSAARILMLSGAGEVRLDETPVRKLATGHMFDETSTTVAPMPAKTVERLTAWQDGRAIFNDDSLATAIQIMNRYDRQRLTIGDESTADLRISGTFRVGDNAAFAEALEAMLSLEIEASDDGLHLSRRAARPAS